MMGLIGKIKDKIAEKQEANKEESDFRKKVENEARQEARAEAATQAKDILKERYKQEEIDKLTGDDKKKFFDKLKQGFAGVGGKEDNIEDNKYFRALAGAKKDTTGGVKEATDAFGSQDKIDKILGKQHDVKVDKMIKKSGKQLSENKSAVAADDKIKKMIKWGGGKI